MTILDTIINKNEVPIIFIGSGVSLRYVENYPNWENLLKKYWSWISGDKDSFYRKLALIRRECAHLPENEQDFYSYVKLASFLENELDKKFFLGELTQYSSLEVENAYKNRISVFKYEIAQTFSELKYKESMIQELELWKQFIRKSKIIITTNYDSFIEDTYKDINSKQELKTYVGQKGFFDSTIGWAELFKIHGSHTDPNSIVITEEDYKEHDRNSILISAKIISSLIDSPIIFMGYSLTDLNVRKIIKDFSSQIPDKYSSKDRIIIVEWKKGEHELLETIVEDVELNCTYTKIETDNYGELYKKISKIEQGLTPTEVRKYQKVIKQLIIDKSASGTLDAVLISPQDLDELENSTQKMVVALGDEKYIYTKISLYTYIEDYIFNREGIDDKTIISFIANQQGRFPYIRYKEKIHSYVKADFLSEREKNNLRKLVESIENSKEANIQKSHIDTIIKSDKEKFNSIKEILATKMKISKIINYICFNIERISLTELEEYIKGYALPLFKENYLKSSSDLNSKLRKLFLLYDLKLNKYIK